ncbi:MAG: damage-inducible protein DinB, partial [Marivirga sp.]|nr:damage-inducible protein DinB [Marivirga sp.]
MKNPKILLLPVGFFAAMIVLLAFNTREGKVETTAKVDQIVADWERAKTYTQEYLNASNEEVINFKPTSEMRTFGQQMLHLAEANYGIGSAATGKTSPVAFGS